MFRPSQDSSVWLELTSKEQLMSPECSKHQVYIYVYIYILYICIYICIYMYIYIIYTIYICNMYLYMY